MSTILIQSDAKNNKLLSQLAQQLGANVIKLTDQQFEEVMLGNIMNVEKSNETVSREEIMKKLS